MENIRMEYTIPAILESSPEGSDVEAEDGEDIIDWCWEGPGASLGLPQLSLSHITNLDPVSDNILLGTGAGHYFVSQARHLKALKSRSTLNGLANAMIAKKAGQSSATARALLISFSLAGPEGQLLSCDLLTSDKRLQATNSDELSCPVCLESYSSTVVPVVMPLCGHSICQTCCVCIQNSPAPQCPTCRRRYTKKNLEKAPKNYDIIKHFEIKSNLCKQHKCSARHWCRNCQELVCADCLLESHRTEDHQIVKVDSIKDEKKAEIVSCGKRLHEEILKEEKEQVKKTVDQVLSLVKLGVNSKKIKDIVQDVEHLSDMNEILVKKTVLNSIEDQSRALLSQSDESKSKKRKICKDEKANTTNTNADEDQNNRPFTCYLDGGNGSGCLAKLTYEDNHFVTYCVRNGTSENCSIMLKMSLLDPYLSLNILEEPLIFMDWSIDSRILGRIVIRLEQRHLNRAKLFWEICKGTQGDTYKDEKITRVRRLLIAKGHLTDPSQTNLLENLETVNEVRNSVHEEGAVISGYNDVQAGVFAIAVLQVKLKAIQIGKVISGIRMLQEASGHLQRNPSTSISIDEVGIIFDSP
ncbi:unnamed protein product, partial [Meganyctiphanes norvegica]